MFAIKYSLPMVLALSLQAFSCQGYARTVVQITNGTDSVCHLDKKIIIQGDLSISPAGKIQPNDTDIILMVSTRMNGPEVDFVYDCGNKKIMLKCKEDFWSWWGSSVHAKLLYADPGITATYVIKPGPSEWNEAGIIEWRLYNNKKRS